jgi:transposase, IS6 family
MPIRTGNPFKGRQYPGKVIVLCVCWYLLYPLSYEHVSELAAERGVEVDASCIWRWGAGICPRTEQALPTLSEADQKELSHRRDLYKGGEDKYLYRALDSTGQTVDFLLTAKRDAAAAKRFLHKAIEASGNAMPRVMNVDKSPAYPAAVEALKAEGSLPRRVVLRHCKYLNNVIEQDHWTVKKRVWLAKGYGSVSERVADTAGNRNGEHDQEGSSEMAGQRRRDRPGAFHRRAVRTSCRLNQN